MVETIIVLVLLSLLFSPKKRCFLRVEFYVFYNVSFELKPFFRRYKKGGAPITPNFLFFFTCFVDYRLFMTISYCYPEKFYISYFNLIVLVGKPIFFYLNHYSVLFRWLFTWNLPASCDGTLGVPCWEPLPYWYQFEIISLRVHVDKLIRSL